MPAHGSDGIAYLGILHHSVGAISEIREGSAHWGGKQVRGMHMVNGKFGRALYQHIAQQTESGLAAAPPHLIFGTSGILWPLDGATLEPLAHPPMHMHHSLSHFFEKQPGKKSSMRFHQDYDGFFNRSYTRISFLDSAGDLYCQERRDHCIWMSLPGGHGEPLPMGRIINYQVHLDTTFADSCPESLTKAHEHINVVIEMALRVLVTPASPVQDVFMAAIQGTRGGDPTRPTAKIDFENQWMAQPGIQFVAEYTVPLPKAGYFAQRNLGLNHAMRVHAHTSNVDIFLLVEGDSDDVGLADNHFPRALSRHQDRLPVILNSTASGPSRTTWPAWKMKAWILSHLVNGQAAAAQIPQLAGDDIGKMRQQLDEFWVSQSVGRKARLLCVKVGNSFNDGCRNYDLRMTSYHPPDGDCLWSWPANSRLTVVFFNLQRPFPVSHHLIIRDTVSIPH